ncbi:hypothetical protein KO516_03830 [Citreicella sp. C3M06]|uniref:hypothetical protein n=1 Tax=Citreicella sp. C3M06 TaxID=2841564 RepID=UPI001C0A02D5|nr:hypothetical protein [Citreicella sp. C3M06]MBU2959969.1 hypothetical protein [Citreicella sp. C3M06]
MSMQAISVEDVTVIGIDLAQSVCQLHGADASGRPVFRKTLWRAQLTWFMAGQPPCLVAMQACASSHDWRREFMTLGPEVRLIPPISVTPFVTRQTHDANDADPVAQAVLPLTMRFVPVKSARQQARSMVLKTRDLLVRHRNARINALRGQFMEHRC